MNFNTKTVLLVAVTMTLGIDAFASSWLIEGAQQPNSPARFSDSYQYNYRKLPKDGTVANEHIPWADSYWPKNRAGASYRWMEHSNENARQDITPNEAKVLFFGYQTPSENDLLNMSQEQLAKLSPAEKYDIYLGKFNYPLTNRYRTSGAFRLKRTVNKHDDAYWEGYCFAWTAVSLQYPEPKPVVRSVRVKGGTIQLPFGSGDIKALLAMNFAEQLPSNPQIGNFCMKTLIFPSTKMLNGKEVFTQYGDTEGLLATDYPEYLRKFQADARRLNYRVASYEGAPNPYSPTFIQDQVKMFNSADCQDMNAGAFHVTMANQLGLLKEGFAIDKTMDNEVWNQPVFKFKTKEVGPVALSANKAPNAVSAIQVKTSVYYADDSDYGWAYWNPTLTNLFSQEKGFLEEYNHYQRLLIKQGDETEFAKYPTHIIDKANYTYNLELDVSGNIVGGEWLTFDRPDVAWKPSKVTFDGLYKRLGEVYEPIQIPAGAIPNFGDDE